MKTTIEIDDALLDRARRASRAEGISLRTLVERGLRQTLEPKASAPVETLVFKGATGFVEPFADASWSRIKEESRRQ